jgi:hydroxymethylbilane synthase
VRVRIGTRGSDLALWQARHVAARLSAPAPGEEPVETELVILQTRGDRIDDVPLTTVEGKAFFTAEIERALLEGEVDLAVHSHKDLPCEVTPGLVIAAIPERAAAGERLLARREARDDGAAFLPLARGVRVGTSSPRRAEQLLALRPDLAVVALRGNVPTRVQRLREGRYDAIVLASAGLDRLGLDTSDLVDVALPLNLVVPAPAQGALAIQAREGDRARIELCRRRLHDRRTAAAVEAERGLLARAGGGCNLPLGVALELEGESWIARGFLGAAHPRPGLPARWAEASGSDPASAAAALFERLASGGATGAGPLGGLRVALAGSAEGPSEIGARLEQLGARVVHERVIGFEDLPADGLRERIARLRPGDALCVTSREAARRLAGVTPPAGVTVAAVGPASARAIAASGLTADVVGEGGARELAERLNLASGARVLFPCAEDARDDLEASLAAQGVEVDRVALYRTIPLGDARLHSGVDARVYMSPSSVEAALELERASPEHSAPRLALGRTTAEALAARGVEAEPASPGTCPMDVPMAELLAAALARLRARLEIAR